MKGLLPDEEKEKIGPKNIGAKTTQKINIQSVITAKPPNPLQVKLFFRILCDREKNATLGSNRFICFDNFL